MATPTNFERETYRVIITRRNGSEILAMLPPSESVLPAVHVLPNRRLPEQLIEGLRDRWELPTYCLFLPNVGQTSENARARKHAVMECIRNNGEPPAGALWRSSANFQNTQSLAGEDSVAVQTALQEIESYTKGMGRGPFVKPGWLKDLFLWVQEQTEVLGLRPTGNFTQWNASPSFSLIRLETNGLAVWFKATGEPNQQEMPISVALARLLPDYVPPILAVHPSWNGWLSGEVPGEQLAEVPSLSAWERAAETLARMQIASIGTGPVLVESQAKDMSLRSFVPRIAPFLARMRQLMALQEKQSPAPLTPDQLAHVGDKLEAACRLLQGAGIPETLGHLDLNPRNIFLSREKTVFLDWAEACVTSPFLSFEYLREHLRRCPLGSAPGIERVTSAYLQPWRSLFPDNTLQKAMGLAPLLTAFACALGTDRWSSSEVLDKPKLAGVFRSLTRRMYREASALMESGEQCLN
jgi:hypothetical protein